MYVGLAKSDITAYQTGMLMMGWADIKNRCEGVADRIEARALAIRQEGRTFVFVSAELCFPTQILRHEVFKRIADLSIHDSDWMLTATHNHSGPSGLSHGLLYNMFNHGFHPEVLSDVADGIADCIRKAVARLEPGRLRWTRHRMPRVLGINRAWKAWNRNRGVRPVDESTKDQAVDRTATLLMVESKAGEPLGAIHWFGLHGTLIHADNRKIRFDHKGMSSRLWEASPPEGARDFVAIFAQAPAGDITPNDKWDPKRGIMAFDTDDLRARETVGRMQQEAAAAAWESGTAIAEDATLDSTLRWLQMEEQPVDPDLAWGASHPRTTKAIVGFGATLGTLEGPGPLGDLPWIVATTNRLRRVQRTVTGLLGRTLLDAPRWPLLEVGKGIRGKGLGILPLQKVYIPEAIDPAFNYMLKAGRGGLKNQPWVPPTLPLQILRIGPIAIVGMSCEPTMMAGRRMAGTVHALMKEAGVQHVIVNGYANGYGSYCTTAEEFEEQGYESAMTLFGRWTLAAWRTQARWLIRDWNAGRDHLSPGPGPWLLSPEEALAQPPKAAPF
ncbi:MAG: hypothetical protein EP343_03550 [Deltaproteobacteria bacterium]|nr:MAG: hypothetical protein EP343_03550 [Deltaproteobacteria bacterium]